MNIEECILCFGNYTIFTFPCSTLSLSITIFHGTIITCNSGFIVIVNSFFTHDNNWTFLTMVCSEIYFLIFALHHINSGLLFGPLTPLELVFKCAVYNKTIRKISLNVRISREWTNMNAIGMVTRALVKYKLNSKEWTNNFVHFLLLFLSVLMLFLSSFSFFVLDVNVHIAHKSICCSIRNSFQLSIFSVFIYGTIVWTRSDCLLD